MITVGIGRNDRERCQTAPVKIDQHARDELKAIARELAQIARQGKVLPGSIGERHMRCGSPGCACHAHPPRLHGPYWQWTRKVRQKTAGRYLSRRQAEHFRPWMENDRRIHELVARLEAIGIAHLENAPRER
jgi:Family of unknown function (DUF6788)